MLEVKIKDEDLEKVLNVLRNKRERAHSASLTGEVHEWSNLIGRIEKGTKRVAPVSKKSKLIEGTNKKTDA